MARLSPAFLTNSSGSQSSLVPNMRTGRFPLVGFFLMVGPKALLSFQSSAFRIAPAHHLDHRRFHPPLSKWRLRPTTPAIMDSSRDQVPSSISQRSMQHLVAGQSAATRASATSLGAKRGRSGGSIFADYEGPVVLVGRSTTVTERSSASDPGIADRSELGRLAGSLRESLGLAVHAITPASASGPVSFEDVAAGATSSQKDFRQTLANHVVVLDLASFGDEQTDAYRRAVSNLYRSDLLCVYVNVVEPVNGVQDDEKWDEFFESNTDYELVVKTPREDDGSVDEDEDAIERAGTNSWSHLEWELARLLGRARLPSAVPGSATPTSNTAHLTMGLNTFFLSLSFPDIESVQPYVASMCEDVDAMEYRVDLLRCRDSRPDLLHGMQLLREYCRPHAARVPALPVPGSTAPSAGSKSRVLEDVMPIVYTVRTRGQAGTYPDDDAGIANMFTLLGWGLRAGVEVLDVESAWNPDATDSLLDRAEERYASQILGSHHVVGKEVTTEDAVLLFEQCQLAGRAHGAKVVLSIESEDKDRMAYEAALIATELARAEDRPVIPHVSLILGDVGQFSRVVNLPFTPVTHESLPFKAAPGQMTSNEIMATRLLTKVFESKKYAILGHNIAYSVSPQMHGAAFAATKLPHEYLRIDVATVEEFVDSPLFQSSDFGGTSVTIPHKQAIIPYVDVLSAEASAIGSVNTLIVKQEFVDDEFQRVVYGDNTDWRGIYNPLRRLLGSKLDGVKDCALILGAGGTARAAAYVAMKKLGMNCVYYNRTPSKAQDLVDSFGGLVLSSLEESGEGSLGELLNRGDEENRTVRVVISTLPAGAKFVLPEWIYDGLQEKPVVFDVNYKPYYTDLLRQAERMNCNFVRGSEMLWEQGVGQFELWTERTAPYRVMKEVVLSNCVQAVSRV